MLVTRTTTMPLVLLPFSRISLVSRYRSDAIVDFIEAEDDGGGGDNWSSKTLKLQSDC